MTAYRVAFQYKDGQLGSERHGLPMALVDARLLATRSNGFANHVVEGRYVVIDAATERVIA